MRPVQWLRGLLKRPLRLERRGLNFHLVLAPPLTEPAPAPSNGEALRRGHEELRVMLGRHPEVRHLMRHLGYVETELAKSGSRALRSVVPVRVLRKALQQLELLTRDEPSEALAQLHSRMAAAVRERGRTRADAGPSVQVSEATASMFDEMERSWTGQVPQEKVSSRPSP
jgi:hypothetical protein